MCVQENRVGRARTDHPVVPGLAWLQLATLPHHSAGGSDIDNASKPVAPPRCGGGRCWVANPPKSQKGSRLHRLGVISPAAQDQDMTGSQGWDRAGHRSGSRPQNPTMASAQSSVCVCAQHGSACGRRVTAPAPSVEVHAVYHIYNVLRALPIAQCPADCAVQQRVGGFNTLPPRRLHLLRQAPSAASDHAAPAHLRNCLSRPRVGFVLFWGRPKRGVEDPSTRGVLGSPYRAPDDSLPRSCHRAPSFYRAATLWASYFGYVLDPQQASHSMEH